MWEIYIFRGARLFTYNTFPFHFNTNTSFFSPMNRGFPEILEGFACYKLFPHLEK